jgi:hypothetical protein
VIFVHRQLGTNSSKPIAVDGEDDVDFSNTATTASTLTKLAWKTRFVEAYNFVGNNNSADDKFYRKNLHTDQLDAFLDSLANIGYAHTLHQPQFVADCLQRVVMIYENGRISDQRQSFTTNFVYLRIA